METPRSLLVTTSFPPEPGGIASLMGNVAQALPRPPLVLAPQPAASVAARGGLRGWPDRHAENAVHVERVRLPHSRLTARVSYRALWSIHPCLYYLWHFWRPADSLARRHSVAVVQCGHVYVGLVALALQLRRRLPYVVYAHAQEIRVDRPAGLPRLDRLIRGLVLRRASAVFVLSAYTGQQVLRWGVKPGRVARLPVGGLPGASPAATVVTRPGPKTLLTVARLVPRKGIDTVLAALPQVLASYPDAHYVVVGSGPDESRLRSLVRQHGLDGKVRFVGAVGREQLAAHYAECDLFVMPAREAADGEVEGFGLAFLEAASFGKPAIAGRSGGQQDAVLDGLTGLVVDPHDPAAVAGAIVRLLEDGALRMRLGRAARDRVERECTWEQTARCVQDTLERVVRLGSPR